ncbi:MAG: rRNA cytosine-C5-methyltransferase [Tannerella sp.]|jgi:16S rRNA C967 or C1407 C5-methylase (RsmB/RsmF family)/NOL1/NOP2/fmu family ribosome biogenesis protein|nr:rRNA cytosine-C5-methyltransferase [Tannerella sp.]
MQIPVDFIARTSRWTDDYSLLEKALQNEPPVSIRLNPAKSPATLPCERVKWCRTGYYLARRPPFTFDPLFHGGAYYVQEASSMFLEQVVRQYVSSPAVCLDLCAAPGGKSTHLLSLLPENSVLVSNEVIRSRCAVLTENILKWGAANVLVTNSDSEEVGRLTHLFDLIVADMPCSGEGMFRKDVHSRGEWSVARVGLCADRQRRIVHDVWDALRPGGLFVYSTCTFNREENEDNIRYITETFHAEALPLSVDAGWNVCCADDGHPAYRFFPHRTKGEGFFLAVLRKADAPPRRISVKTRYNRRQKPPAQICEWLRRPEMFRFETCRGVVHAIPEHASDIFGTVSERMRLFSAGIPAGQVKGKDVIPAHALALSTELHPDAFPAAEQTWDEAVRYLQREMPALREDVPKGLYTVTCRHLPLGFARNIGSRVNNLYPQEWRIRSRDIPAEAPRIFP